MRRKGESGHPWLTRGTYTRKYSHTTTYSRGDKVYEWAHYWTPSTAGKRPAAVCTIEQWQRWEESATEGPATGQATVRRDSDAYGVLWASFVAGSRGEAAIVDYGGQLVRVFEATIDGRRSSKGRKVRFTYEVTR